QSRIRFFQTGASEFVENFAAGCAGVFRKNVAVSEAGKMQLLKFAVNRNRAAAHPDGINHNVVTQKDLHYVAIAGITAVFASIADYENHLAALLRPLGKVERSFQNSVIQHMRLLLGGRGRDSRVWIHRHVIDGWTLRA